MIQLTPQEKYPITRQLEDPTDVNVYYVQAVITQSGNDKVIATVKMPHISGQRYRANWEVLVPENTFIDIVVTVYTDSNYSVLSQIYGVQADTYIVQTRWGIQFIQYPAQPTVVDYEKIDKLINKALEGIGIEIPDVDYEGMHEKLFKRISDAIGSIQMPEYKPQDLGPLISRLDKLHNSIKNLPLPKEVDLSDLTDSISGLHALHKDIEGAVTAHAATLKKSIAEHGEKLLGAAEEIQKNMPSQFFVPAPPRKTKTETKESASKNAFESRIKNLVP